MYMRMIHNYFDSSDPTGMYYNPMPEHMTKEEFEEYQKLTVKYLWRSIVVFFLMLAALAVMSIFTSCAVQKTEHDQQTHVVKTDTAGTEQSHSGQVTSQSVNVDSIIRVVMQRTREEFARQEQEHETTTETLTETIDSLGRIVRQSQKTTDRTLSRQEQQRIDRLEQTFEQQIHRALLEHDSLWHERFAQYQASMSDSLQSVRDLQQQRSASNPLTWWQQMQLWLGRLVLVALAVLAAWFILKKKTWWLRLLKP